MMQFDLRVPGMGCRRCVREVTSRLRDVSGVETIAADTTTNTVLLRGTMTARDVLAAFAGSKYAPMLMAETVIRPGPPNRHEQHAQHERPDTLEQPAQPQP
jgi:copper chaperone CopZ